MHAFAKWVAVLAVSAIVAAVALFVVLHLAGDNDSGWSLATAWAVGVISLPMTVGSWWVNRPAQSMPDSPSAPQNCGTAAGQVAQTASNVVVLGSQHGVAAANIAHSRFDIGTDDLGQRP